MKKYLFILVLFLIFSLSFAQTAQVDVNFLKQLIDILQKLVQSDSAQLIQLQALVSQTISSLLMRGVEPAVPIAKPITPEVLRPILPDENREDDYIVQLNNLRITRIVTSTPDVKAIFFVVRDTGWRCMLYESEGSSAVLPCLDDIRKQIRLKELVIKITDETILLSRDRKKINLSNFQLNDKINVYGYIDKNNYGIEALVLRKIIGSIPIIKTSNIPTSSSPIIPTLPSPITPTSSPTTTPTPPQPDIPTSSSPIIPTPPPPTTPTSSSPTAPTPTPPKEAPAKIIVPVLVLRFIPTQDSVTVDTNIADDISPGTTVQEIRNRINNLNSGLINALEKGSHNFLDYNVVATREYLQELPKLPNSRLVDYKKIMTDLNVCNYIDNLGVKEIWLWGYHGYKTDIWESNMSSSYGDISNSNRDPNDLPLCSKTYVVYHFNYNRELGMALESYGHQIEAILNWVDGRDLTPPDRWSSLLFWGKFVGSDYSHKIINPGCGWMHYPPNGRYDYDWYNKTPVLSDCDDWKPDGTGTKKLISCKDWTGNEGCVDNGGGESFKIWWMQHLPGKDNNLFYNGKKLRNWWEFIGDFDNALKVGKSLTY